jgi:hypothetical protein
MPVYYFHLHDGPSRFTDQEGVRLPDPEAAWYQGMRSAREIFDKDLKVGAFKPGRLLEVVDEDGDQIWAVPFEDVASLS